MREWRWGCVGGEHRSGCCDVSCNKHTLRTEYHLGRPELDFPVFHIIGKRFCFRHLIDFLLMV